MDTPCSLSSSSRCRVLHQAGAIAAGVALENGPHLQGASRDLLQGPCVQEAYLGLELES